MIPLLSLGVAVRLDTPRLGRVSFRPVHGDERRRTVRVFTGDADEPTKGYAAVLLAKAVAGIDDECAAVHSCEVEHLTDGDVVSVAPGGRVRTLYRRQSPHNTLFTTERCNSLCVMCSQPPREIDDSWRTAELLELIDLIDPDTRELGISGGEPTLLGEGLIQVLQACKNKLPHTSIHVLTNGRLFSYPSLANQLGSIAHPDLMIGIPLYSAVDTDHDFIVQARGAFDETVRGLHNLASAGVPVEIRIVVHRATHRHLEEFARFVYRNLTFASHVAFMGMEIIGLAKANLADLWVDPIDYARSLDSAVEMLSVAGMNVSVYNHQLCTLPETLWPFCRQSISDWKREYAPICGGCGKQEECGGFFAWNLGHGQSRGLRALL